MPGNKRKQVLRISLGAGLALVLYFSDYTVLFRYPKILYMGYTVLALLLSAFELRNGIYARGYSFAFYLMLFYPVLLVGMLYYFKNSDNHYRTTFYVLCLCVPIALSVVHQSLAAFILLTLSSCFLYYYGLQKNGCLMTCFLCVSSARRFCLVSGFLSYMHRQISLANHSLQQSSPGSNLTSCLSIKMQR